MTNEELKMSNDYELKATKVTASDKLPPLKDGEIDVTNLPKDIWIINLGRTIEKFISKKGKAHYYNFNCPVGLIYKNLKQVDAMETGTISFDSVDDIISYLKEHKHTLVYQVNYSTIQKKYLLRKFSVGTDMYWTPKAWQYHYTIFRMWWNRKFKVKKK